MKILTKTPTAKSKIFSIGRFEYKVKNIYLVLLSVLFIYGACFQLPALL